MERPVILRLKGNNLRRLFRFLLIVFGILLVISNNLVGQVVGNPGSSQSAVQVCEPSSYIITYTFEFISPANPVPSNRVLFRLEDIDDGSLIEFQNYSNIAYQIGPAPFFRKYIEQSHQFDLPLNGDCEYRVTILFYYDGTIIPSASQIQIIGNWHVDDEADGVIAITPDIEEICEGQDVVDFTFQDASTFACVSVDLNNPNTIERHVQFVYNTNPTGGQGIPNLSIDVFGTTVVLTDASGAPVANLWTVDPTDGSAVAAYSTSTGYFEGPVISTGFSPTGGSQQTFPISFPGAGTVVDDYFEVTVRNWNYCNQWNGDQYPDNPPNSAESKISTARIVILDAPDAPTITDPTICFGGSTLLDPSSTPVGEFHWYDEFMVFIITGDTYDPGVTVPDVYTYYVTDQQLAGDLCEGPATEVTLTINPIPAIPTITVTNGATPMCWDGVSTVELTASGDGNTVSWQWYEDGGIMGGETGNTITLGPAVQDHDYTVVAIGIAATFCTSNPSTAQNVTIDPVPTADAGSDDDMCTSSPYTLSGVIGGAASEATWTTSGDGLFDDDMDMNAEYTPGVADIVAGTVTLTLTTDDPAGPCDADDDDMVLTVIDDVTVYAGHDETICSTETPVIANASITGDHALYTWTVIPTANGNLTNTGTLTPTFTPTPAGITAGTATVRLSVDADAPCGDKTDDLIITIHEQPTADAGGGADIC
ncbi:MAG: hypothetical protein K8R35_05315, partial [Bacteroidales bacterium]|nr:hypothetical protein [Bacteroidales bacterium]